MSGGGGYVVARCCQNGYVVVAKCCQNGYVVVARCCQNRYVVVARCCQNVGKEGRSRWNRQGKHSLFVEDNGHPLYVL